MINIDGTQLLNQKLWDGFVSILKVVHKDFPDFLSHLVLVLQDRVLCFKGSVIKPLFLKDRAAEESVRSHFNDTMMKRKASGLAQPDYVVKTKQGAKGARVIAMKAESDDLTKKLSLSGTLERMYIFLHELGHLLASNGYYSEHKNTRECVADAYAALFLRNVGLYEQFTNHTRYLLNDGNIVEDGRSPIHYTRKAYDAVEAIPEDSIKAHTHKDIIRIAEMIGQTSGMPEERIDYLRSVFNGCSSASDTLYQRTASGQRFLDKYQGKDEQVKEIAENYRKNVAIACLRMPYN